MINEATFDSYPGHLLDYTSAQCNKTRKKTLKLRVSLVYLELTRGREISSLFDFNETAGAGLAKSADESYMIT